MTLELGGVAVSLALPRGPLARAAARRYRLFRSRRPPALRLAVSLMPAPRGRVVRPFLPSPTRVPRGWGFRRGDAELEVRGRSGTLALWPSVYSLDAALRVLYFHLLARRAFFLHAAALRNGRGVWLFPGRSGAGKSTLVRAAGPARSLGDELVLVRRAGRLWRAEGTPFWGNGRAPRTRLTGPVSRICFLRKADGGSLAPVGPAQAQRLALRCLLWFPGRPERDLRRAWSELVKLCREVPARRLSFPKGQAPWKLMKEDA